MTIREKLSAAIDEIIGIGMDNNIDLNEVAGLLRQKAEECEKQMAELPA